MQIRCQLAVEKRDYFLALGNAESDKVERRGYVCATLAPCPIVAQETGRYERKKGNGVKGEGRHMKLVIFPESNSF